MSGSDISWKLLKLTKIKTFRYWLTNTEGLLCEVTWMKITYAKELTGVKLMSKSVGRSNLRCPVDDYPCYIIYHNNVTSIRLNLTNIKLPRWLFLYGCRGFKTSRVLWWGSDEDNFKDDTTTTYFLFTIFLFIPLKNRNHKCLLLTLLDCNISMPKPSQAVYSLKTINHV